MNFPKTLATAATLALAATTLNAEGMRIGAGLSMFGPSVEVQSRLSNAITVRGTYAGGLTASGTQTADDLDYSLSGKLGGLSAMFNYHMPGGFRVGAGFFKSNSSVTGTMTGTDGDQVGGTAISGDFTLQADTTFARSYSPIATVGLDIPLFADFVLSTDAGVVFNGGYNVNLTQTSGATTIAASVLADGEKNIEDQLSSYNYFPYVSLMVGKWF